MASSPLGVLRLGRAGAEQLASMSRDALDRPLAYDAELVVGEPADAALVLGALQRTSELGEAPGAGPLLRRGSGGAEALVGPGTLWLQLALARPDALVDCEPSRLLNRHVRPLLRALAKVGALAHYFDRDWISASKRPVGMIAFSHDAGSGRALVEVMVAVSTPFAPRSRASYLGKAPATLEELGASVDVDRLAGAVIEAYGAAYGRPVVDLDLDAARARDALTSVRAAPPAADREPPWASTRDEAIGIVAAGRDHRGVMRIGGELMVSRDAVARLEERLRAEEGAAGRERIGAVAVGQALDESLGAPGVALLGVRSLVSLRDVLVEALAQ